MTSLRVSYKKNHTSLIAVETNHVRNTFKYSTGNPRDWPNFELTS